MTIATTLAGPLHDRQRPRAHHGRVVTCSVLASAGLLTAATVATASTAPQSSAAARTVSIGKSVCFDITGWQDVCLDGEHVAHLRLAGLQPGECAEVSFSGERPTALSLQRVRQVACPARGTR